MQKKGIRLRKEIETDPLIALLDERHKGSNWLQWRTRLQPIRTASEITAHIKILPAKQPYLYQKLSSKAAQLRLLGMSYDQIGKALNVSRKTVINACKSTLSLRGVKRRSNPKKR